MQQNAELRDLVIKSVSLVINMGRLRRFVGGGVGGNAICSHNNSAIQNSGAKKRACPQGSAFLDLHIHLISVSLSR